jgi:hypothetical protein
VKPAKSSVPTFNAGSSSAFALIRLKILDAQTAMSPTFNRFNQNTLASGLNPAIFFQFVSTR